MLTFREDTKIGSKVPLIKTADLNDKSVTERKLADGSITKDKIAPGAVTSEKIADGAVTKDKLSFEILDGNMVEATDEDIEALFK